MQNLRCASQFPTSIKESSVFCIVIHMHSSKRHSPSAPGSTRRLSTRLDHHLDTSRCMSPVQKTSVNPTTGFQLERLEHFWKQCVPVLFKWREYIQHFGAHVQLQVSFQSHETRTVERHRTSTRSTIVASVREPHHSKPSGRSSIRTKLVFVNCHCPSNLSPPFTCSLFQEILGHARDVVYGCWPLASCVR